MLGKGEYGSVSVLNFRNEKFALKQSDLGVYPENIEVTMASLREEAMNCVHPNIIKRFWSRFWKGKFQLCMELGQPVDQAPGHRILHDIGQGLCFMHAQGFLHRDVKPHNIVKVGEVYKLIDFGLSRKKEGSVKMTGYMWSRWFRPPELLRLKDYELHSYDGRSDMWSLALTAHFLQHGNPLFYGDAEEILDMYSKYKPEGIMKRLVCEYDDRWTARQMFEENGIDIVGGTLSNTVQRSGNVGDFVRCILDGNEEEAHTYSHEKIYFDL